MHFYLTEKLGYVTDVLPYLTIKKQTYMWKSKKRAT